MAFQFTWLGHSGLRLDIGDKTALIDPFLSGNPLGAGDPDTIPADLILLTHAHADHVGDTIAIAKRTGATVACNVEMSNWFKAKGLEDVIGFNTGGTIDAGFLTAKLTKAFHSSSFADGTYGGQPGGLIIRAGGYSMYHAGDTSLFGDMALIGEEGIDVAVLPIGDHFTMGPDDSIRAIRLIQPKYVMPVHYNTWPPLQQNVAEWAESVNRDTAAQPIVMDPGGTYTLD